MSRKPISDDQTERYFVSLARCANETLYGGYATNAQAHLACHNAGQGGRSTRINRPLTLIASWAFSTRLEARRAELQLKRLSPEKKQALVVSTILLPEENLEDVYPQTTKGHSV